MAILTYPLNNIEYDASDVETYMATRTSGVYAKNDFDCTVTGTDTNITINSGIAWISNHQFAGKVVRNDSELVVACGASDNTLPRYDVIALQFDKQANETKIVCKHGTAATQPQIPDITQTVAIYELYLYAIYRPAGVAAITQANITDLRLTQYCGLMADSITKIDTSAISAQITALLDGLKDNSGVMLKSDYADKITAAQNSADGAQNTADTHIANKSNPHGVTKAQIGLGNVTNVEAMPKANFSFSNGTLNIKL